MRLTGSGLGCPTWPECVPGSFTPVRTDESSIHDLVEFGNRTLTFVVAMLALRGARTPSSRSGPHRGRLQLVAVGVLAGIPAQAVLGGITVLTGLNPWLVIGHFLLSMALVALSTALVRGSRDDESGPGELLVHPIARRRRDRHGVVGGVVVVLGTIVTGLGPALGRRRHPGAHRLRPARRVVAARRRRHALLRARRRDPRRRAHHLGPTKPRRAWWAVLAVTVAQGAIGYVQYFTGCRASSCCSTCSGRACSSPRSRGACSRRVAALSDRDVPP